MIGYSHDDGGRAAAGFKGSAGDCVVRAIAILTREPYPHIYRRMASAMKQAGYSASGDGYRQKPRAGARPTISCRKVQNLVKVSYGLRRVNLGRGPRPTYTEAWVLHGNCLVGTTKHISAIIDKTLRDTFDSRFYDGRLYGRTAAEQRKAQSIWVPVQLSGKTITTPDFDPIRTIPPPKS